MNISTGLLRSLREARGLSQRSLYQASGVSDSTIQKGERDPYSLRRGTWMQLLRGLAKHGLFSDGEMEVIFSTLQIDERVIHALQDDNALDQASDYSRKAALERFYVALDRAHHSNQLRELVMAFEAFSSRLPPHPSEK